MKLAIHSSSSHIAHLSEKTKWNRRMFWQSALSDLLAVLDFARVQRLHVSDAELLCLVLALPISHPASARGMEAQAAIDCSSGGRNQAEMNTCAAHAAEAASAKLDSLVKELELKLQAPAAAELRKLQADWREYRNRDCDWERGAFAGGSVGPQGFSK